MTAQVRFTASAPVPASVSGMGAGGSGSQNLSQAVHSVAKPGTSRMPASTMPRRARRGALHVSATKMSRLIDAVGEQRNRTDRKRDREFHAEIGEIEQCNHEDGAAQR